MQTYIFKHSGTYLKKAVLTPAKEFHHFTENQALKYLIDNTKDLIKVLEKEKERLEDLRAKKDQRSLF
jgi:hypothetical protein